ncbi:MAG: chemotaxis protein CheX [Bdellovibrionota bacterium]
MLAETKFFQLNEEPDYFYLKLIGPLDNSNHSGFDEVLSQITKSKTKNVIVNFEHVEHMNLKWGRSLLQVCASLRPEKLKVYLILVPSEVRHWIDETGIDSAFAIVPTMREALNFLGIKPKKKLDTDFINPFLDATVKVLEVQASLKFIPGKMTLKKADEPHLGDVSGIIGIVSSVFNGSVIITFPEATFMNVMSGLLGEELKELTKEHIDGAGEITNMIFGQAKVVLNERGYGIKMALPSVISGKNHSTTSLTKGPVLVIPFSGNAGDFFVEVCLSE